MRLDQFRCSTRMLDPSTTVVVDQDLKMCELTLWRTIVYPPHIFRA